MKTSVSLADAVLNRQILMLVVIVMIVVRLIVIIIKRVFVKLPGWASGGGHGLTRGGLISGFLWAIEGHHHPLLLLFHIFFLSFFLSISCALFFCFVV